MNLFLVGVVNGIGENSTFRFVGWRGEKYLRGPMYARQLTNNWLRL